jgi:transposase
MSTTARVTIEPTTAELPPTQPKRRRYSIAEKRRIVEASFEPKTSVARVAREHGMNANQVFSWRRLYQRGRLGGPVAATPGTVLLPVMISEPPASPAPGGGTPVPPPASFPTGTIQLQLPRGRLRIEGAVDPDSLRLVLQCMLA